MSPPPIRSFAGVTAVSFTPTPANRLPADIATPERDAGRPPSAAPLPSSWLLRPLLEDDVGELEEQPLNALGWAPTQGDNPDTKRPRK
jgi:hypothetical protein